MPDLPGGWTVLRSELKATVQQIDVLRRRVSGLPPHAAAEIERLERQIRELEEQLQQQRSAWDHVQLARHPDRPYTLDMVDLLFDKFLPIHGDRKFGEDPSIVGGMAVLAGRPVMVLGHQKGRNTKDRLYRNYGMPKPEGYRKAVRLMQLAEKFGRPVLTFIDTPGAYPGIGAEKRGQAEAIAFNLRAMSNLRVPIISTVLGEGGSGGALAIGVADRILMLEHSIYSVISPESCSAILWKDQDHAREAAECLKLTANHLEQLGVVDEIIPEPPGGAHTSYDQTAQALRPRLIEHLRRLEGEETTELLERRFLKFRRMGSFIESEELP